MGSLPVPPGTLKRVVDRQPDGFTCGTETFAAIARLLRLPTSSPDQNLQTFRRQLKTTARSGTDPYRMAEAARDHLGIQAEVRNHMTLAELAELVNGTQDHIDRLEAGHRPDRPLTLVAVTYQAWIAETRKESRVLEDGRVRMLPVRGQRGEILWENDWSDGHWSLVNRVVTPDEDALLGDLVRRSSEQQANSGNPRFRPLRAGEAKDGLVILGDPSNGTAFSYQLASEFDRRWHDTNDNDEPAFIHTGLVLTVLAEKLEEMQRDARHTGEKMFSTNTFCVMVNQT
jgi:hypothetical protein